MIFQIRDTDKISHDSTPPGRTQTDAVVAETEASWTDGRAWIAETANNELAPGRYIAVAADSNSKGVQGVWLFTVSVPTPPPVAVEAGV